MWITLLVDPRSPWGWMVGEMDTTQPFLLKELKDAGSLRNSSIVLQALCVQSAPMSRKSRSTNAKCLTCWLLWSEAVGLCRMNSLWEANLWF